MKKTDKRRYERKLEITNAKQIINDVCDALGVNKRALKAYRVNENTENALLICVYLIHDFDVFTQIELSMVFEISKSSVNNRRIKFYDLFSIKDKSLMQSIQKYEDYTDTKIQG